MNIESRMELLRAYSRAPVVLRFTGLALVARLFILGYFIYMSHLLYPERLVDGFIFRMNDYEYFLGTIDNYHAHGTITYADQVKPFAGRMPGYGFPYLLIRFFTEREAGLAILVTLQIVLGALSTYVLALIALLIFENTRIFKAVFWCFAISAPTIVFDIFTLSESFSISAIIFFHFFLFKYCFDPKIKNLLLAGFFLAWAIFLRPFIGSFMLLTPLFIILWRMKKETFTGAVAKAMIFILPFVVFETAWVIRNYLALGRFIPLETSLTESYGENGLYRTSAIGIRTMIHAWGGETGEFYDGSEAWWFHDAKGDEIKNYVFSRYVFNGPFNRDSLESLKFTFNQSVNHDLSDASRDSCNQLANRIALRYAEGYRHENPFRFYVINPFKMYGRLIFSNGTRLLIMPAVSKMNLSEKGIKGFFLLFYYGIILSGTGGMILFLWRAKNYPGSSLLILSYPWVIATTLVFYASFVIIEYRYVISAFPIFLLFGVYSFFNLPFLSKTTHKPPG